MNGKLPSEATNSDKDATVKCALRFQELQAVLALYNSERLYCGKTAGFGWDVNGDEDDWECWPCCHSRNSSRYVGGRT